MAEPAKPAGTGAPDAGGTGDTKPDPGKAGADKSGAGGTGNPKPGDAKPGADDTSGKGTGDKPAAGATDGPPEKYTLSIPKDAATWLDANDLKEIEAIAREHGLSNDDAQDLVKRQGTARAATSAMYRAEVENDPTLGGDNLANTERTVRSVLDRFAPAGDPLNDALRRDLNRSGYGNKLSTIKFLHAIGQAMGEDQPAGGGQGGRGGSGKDPAAVLYGATTK